MSAPRNKKTAKGRLHKKRGAKKMTQQMAAQLRPGMPAADSVRAVVDFVSPPKVHYTILKTSEMDAYDEPYSAQPRSNKKRRPR
jgi:hypothetical protein